MQLTCNKEKSSSKINDYIIGRRYYRTKINLLNDNLTLILTAGGPKEPFNFEPKLVQDALSRLFLKNKKCLTKYLKTLFCLRGF
jgi:hypothetical protein